MRIDKMTSSRGEANPVSPVAFAQTLKLAAIEFRAIQVLAEVGILRRRKVDIPVALVDFLHIADFPFTGCNLSNDGSFWIEVVNMSPTIAITQQHKGTVRQIVRRTGIVHPAVMRFAKQSRRITGPRVDFHKVQPPLGSVLNVRIQPTARIPTKAGDDHVLRLVSAKLDPFHVTAVGTHHTQPHMRDRVTRLRVTFLLNVSAGRDMIHHRKIANGRIVVLQKRDLVGIRTPCVT